MRSPASQRPEGWAAEYDAAGLVEPQAVWKRWFGVLAGMAWLYGLELPMYIHRWYSFTI